MNFNTPGTAVVTLTANVAGIGCLSKDSVIETVSTDVSDNPDVIYSAPQFICLTAFENSYQWGYDDAATLDSNIIDGEIDQNYTNYSPDFSGKYYWVITMRDGCMQKSYANAPVGLNSINAGGFDVKVYPNPTESIVTVEVGMPTFDNMQIELIDMLGRRIQAVAIVNRNTRIFVRDLASGCYFINCIKDGIKISTTKLIKI